MTDVCIVLCTCPDTNSAERIASALIEQQLAACVSISHPITSLYRWEGKVEKSQEFQLVIKTQHAVLNDAYDMVNTLHPYDVPEWLVIQNITGSEPYIEWLESCIR
ncbi:divalent-cation tolerance protein CutA [Aestuariibacter sp. AA17]|uniref:Divalent-cation tolerance protein CutA n=1 Tax=Fluctibacter corallii TaxID=2984329 RepID=A0ABT3AC87_9ALTE|nr:divalent-cation tolerance protein CutA [Aestuariibacter sp. AA17]MCV2886287.1 divalent-cation tolerance protein CutA [Aestuariibacter sp. AA17]